MKSLSRTLLVSLTGLIVLPLQSLTAATLIKADNTSALNTGASWVGGTAPTSADIAQWDNTLTSANTATVSAASSWGGIKVVDPAGAVTINLAAGLTLGATDGIDLSTATQNLSFTGATQTITWAGNLAVNVAADRQVTIDTRFGSSSGFTKRGAGVLWLGGTLDNAGTTATVEAGTLVLAKASTTSVHSLGGGTHTVNGGILQLAGTGNDQIYDSAALNVAAGVFDLNGRNEAIGTFNLGATARLTNTAAATNSVLTAGTGTGSGTITGLVEDGAGTVSFVKTGTGTIILAGLANTFTGGVTINDGILRAVANGSLGAAGSTIFINNGATLLNADSDLVLDAARVITLGTGGGTLRAGWGKTLRVDGRITGTGPLRISNDSGVIYLASTTGNNYTGATYIGGTGSGTNASLTLSAANALPTGTDLIFDAGTGGTATLALGGNAISINSLSTASGSGNITSSASGTTVNVTGNTTTTFSGTISNGVHLLHSGSGELTLTAGGDNSSVRATVSGGTLVLAKASTSGIHALGGATHVVNNTGTLRFAGTGNDQIYTSSTVTVNSGGTVDFNGRNEGWKHLNGVGLVTNSAAGTNSVMTLGEGGVATEFATFSGQINNGAGTMAVNKVGDSTFIVTGANLYSGGTTVSAGVLGGTGTAGTGTMNVGSGATLSPGSNSGQAMLGVGQLTIGGDVNFNTGSTYAINLAFGGSAAQTDRLILNGSAGNADLTITGAALSGTWGGSAANLYQGTLSTSNMFWITEGADSVTGLFANGSAVSAWGLFGSAQYSEISLGGQQFALFYNAQYGLYNVSGLTGGHDLLLVAIPEPSRALLLLFASLVAVFIRRRIR